MILIRRTEVRPFTERRIELVNTFADQAVIAIENSRLFEAEQASKRELQESLKYQTAISEVLSVISRSQTEIRPVFDAILESAVRLCDADQGGTGKVENGMLLAINWYPDTPEVAAVFRDNFPRPVDRTSLVGQAVIEKRVLHVPDLEAPDRTIISTTVSQRLGYRYARRIPEACSVTEPHLGNGAGSRRRHDQLGLTARCRLPGVSWTPLTRTASRPAPRQPRGRRPSWRRDRHR